MTLPEPTVEAKIVVKCKTCPTLIEVTPPSLPSDIPQYETVIKRGNIVCQRCFRWLSKKH